jgi:autotransporter family porin
LFLANFMSSDFNTSPDLQGVGGLTGIGTHMNVQQFGGHLDIGYRFQFNPWFFEPQGTIEVVHTEFCGSTAINCFNNPGVVFANTVVSLNDTSVRGRLGGRIGTSWLWGGWTVEPSVTGSLWETFTGTNVASLTSNGFVLDLSDVNQQRTQGEVGGMVNVFGNGSSWSGFVKGDYRFASGYSDGSIKGGLRYQWGTGY